MCVELTNLPRRACISIQMPVRQLTIQRQQKCQQRILYLPYSSLDLVYANRYYRAVWPHHHNLRNQCTLFETYFISSKYELKV